MVDAYLSYRVVVRTRTVRFVVSGVHRPGRSARLVTTLALEVDVRIKIMGSYMDGIVT